MTQARFMRRALVGLSVAALVAVSGCGDDDDDAGGGSASADPIKIMTFTSLENPGYSGPQKRAAAEAAVRGLNEDGGIGGRQVELVFCDTNFDPNLEAGCARQAVEDGVVAVAGSTTFFPNTLPILERGGVAYVGGQGLVPAEVKSEVSFPISSGIPGWSYGMAAQALERGAQRISIVQSPIAAAQFGAQMATAALGEAGVTPLRVVDAPVSAPDQSTVASQASDGADAVLIAVLPNDAIKVVQSLRQGGYQGTIASITSIFTPDVIEALGQGAEGMLLTSQLRPPTDAQDPAILEFNSEMDAVDASASKDERSLATWASFQILAGVIEGLDGDVTAATVLDALNSLADPVETGLTPPYAVTDAPSPLPDYPRIFNPDVVFTEVRDGQITRIGDAEYVDPFEAIKQIATR